MELEHRFEVPVGIDTAWASLLNMETVAPCFPGATLETIDGDDFTGSVKVKLGPIQLTYKGKATIVEKDEAAHRAVFEASGNAARSSSTASMTVSATATAVTADRTAVDMVTSLSITGRPAQFGRGVMVEVGNKLLGQFADCLSGKLSGAQEEPAVTGPAGTVGPQAAAAAGSEGVGFAGSPAGDGAPGPSASSEESSSGATEGSPSASSQATSGAAGASAAAGMSAGTSTGAGAGPRHAAFTRSPEPIDLLESAGAPVLKRLLPIIAGVIALFVLRKLLRKKCSRRKSS